MAVTNFDPVLAEEYKKIELKHDGDRTDGQQNADGNQQTVHGVESIGNVVITIKHPLLLRLGQASGYESLNSGSIALTGFKLESTFLTTDQSLDNSKIIPLLNGDTMSLTNSNKSGSITFACTRTAAGITGGDMIAIFDYIRSQGDSYGGSLFVNWVLNAIPREIEFKAVTVAKCPPITLAGNDLPDLSVVLNFATYHDNQYPTW